MPKMMADIPLQIKMYWRWPSRIHRVSSTVAWGCEKKRFENDTRLICLCTGRLLGDAFFKSLAKEMLELKVPPSFKKFPESFKCY